VPSLLLLQLALVGIMALLPLSLRKMLRRLLKNSMGLCMAGTNAP
ncbi:hypothetical protein L195_g063465, partial [Trifolium pratense]